MTRAAATEDPRARIGRLILALRQAGVDSLALLEAIERTPREAFAPPDLADSAWSNVELPIACGQSLTRPLVSARLLAALAPEKGDRVLEIGTGSGCQTAVLARLSRRIFTIDRWRLLVDEAAGRFRALGLTRIEARFADGLDGWAEEGPFDRILLNGSVPAPPDVLLAQLARGGVLIAPEDHEDGQWAVRRRREAQGWSIERLFPTSFLPLTPQTSKEL